MPQNGPYRTLPPSSPVPSVSPFEPVLELLLGRTMTTQDWREEIGAAKNWRSLYTLMVVLTTFTAIFLVALGVSCGFRGVFLFKMLAGSFVPVFVIYAIAFYTEWVSHRQAFEWRWGRDGIGLQLLERLLEQELLGVRNRLEAHLKRANINWNAPEWTALSIVPSPTGNAIDLLKALQAKRDVPFTDPQRWGTWTLESSVHVHRSSETKQKDVARNLTHLVQRLKELQQNKLFEDFSSSLCPCMGLTPSCRNGTDAERQELTRLLRLTSLALHAALF